MLDWFRNAIVIVLCLVFLILSSGVRAKERQRPDSTWHEWNFKISPYFWFVGFKGTIYRPPVPSNYPEPPPRYDFDVGFSDIRNSLKFALMLAGKYQNKHITAQFNISSLILESEAITPLEIVLTDNIVNLAYFGGDFAIGYRAIRNEKWEFDPTIGLKFIYFDVGLSSKVLTSIPVRYERNRIWIDPVIGANIKYFMLPKLELSAYADVGPSLFNNAFTWQVMAGASYRFTKVFLISLGYRYYLVEAPTEEAIYNGSIKGWLLRFSFHF